MLSTVTPYDGLVKLMVVFIDIDSRMGPAAASISKDSFGTTWLLIWIVLAQVSGIVSLLNRAYSSAINCSIS